VSVANIRGSASVFLGLIALCSLMHIGQHIKCFKGKFPAVVWNVLFLIQTFSHPWGKNVFVRFH